MEELLRDSLQGISDGTLKRNTGSDNGKLWKGIQDTRFTELQHNVEKKRILEASSVGNQKIILGGIQKLNFEITFY